ncbi:MAG: GAF domain-containing protein [Anaerolineaceae bacterium]
MDEPLFSPVDHIHNDLICRYFADGTLIDANENFIHFFGLLPDRLVGANLLDLLPAEETGHFYHHVALLCVEQTCVTFEQRAWRSDGSERWLRWTLRGTFSPEGALFEIRAVGQDITARKWATEQLEKADLCYQSMFEGAQEGVFQLTADNRLIQANPSLARILGFSSLESMFAAVNTPGGSNFLPEPCWQEVLRRCENSDQVHDFEFPFARKDGSNIWVSLNLRVIRKPNGRHASFEGTLRDITDRYESELRLVETASQISALSKIGQQVLANLEEGRALCEFTNSLSELWGGDTCVTVFLVSGADLIQTVSNGIVPQGDGSSIGELASRALKDNESLMDAAGDRSCIAAPLRMGDHVIGVIEATRSASLEFHPTDLQLLAAAAQWAALAIHNARQHAEIQNRLQELQSMSTIRQALSETFDLECLFQLIVDSAIQMAPQAHGAVIHLLETKTPNLVATSMAGEIATRIPEIHLDVEDRIIREVVLHNEIINIPDLTQDPRSDGQAHRLSMHSLLVAPVQSANGCFGTISLLSADRNAFSADDERVISSLGLEAAIAIQNARLYQAERRQREIAEALGEAAAAFNRSLDLNEVLDCILDQTMRVISCRISSILLVEGDEAHLVRQRSNTETTQMIAYPESTRLPLSTPTLKTMMETQHPILVQDAHHFSGWLPMDAVSWVRSYAAAPLVVDQKSIGFLNVDSEFSDCFNEETTHILQTFAAHAAIAIQNARLYSDLESALQQEKAMRAQLLQADKLSAMGRMASSIAHEVNNPLQAIQGCLERARAVNITPDRRNQYLKLAEEELERLSHILQRVLDFQRPGMGTPERQDVHPIIENVLALSGKRLQSARIQIIREWMSNPPLVRVASNQLKQVFLNLLLNAADAMSDGGTLIIRTELQTEPGNIWLKIIFKDNGPGIRPQDMDKIFEPFYSTKDRGTGLGLWVSHSIILAHQGKLTVESQLGKGSVFTIWLPVASTDLKKGESRKEKEGHGTDN